MPSRKPRSRISLVEHEVTVTDLDPRLEGVRIAHLSDVHCGPMTPRAHVRRAVAMANAAGADIIALTGDYVCWRRREIPMVAEQLAGLEARRVVATLGNHDYYAGADGVARALSGSGYSVLRNQHTTIDFDGAPLHLIGLDDPVTRRHDLTEAFRGVPATGTRIVLSHCPETADQVSDGGAAVVLSGHTHGGQIYVKGVTDRVLRKMARRYRRGFYDVARTTLYVTTGVGYSGVRVRAGEGTRAEVAVLTLRGAARCN